MVCVLSLTGTLDTVGVSHIEQMLTVLVEDFLYGSGPAHKKILLKQRVQYHSCKTV